MIDNILYSSSFLVNFSSFLAISPLVYMAFGKGKNKTPLLHVGKRGLGLLVDSKCLLISLPVLARNLSLPNMTRWRPQSL